MLQFNHNTYFLRLNILFASINITIFGPYLYVRSFVSFRFMNEFFQKFLEYYKNHFKKKNDILTKHELNLNL